MNVTRWPGGSVSIRCTFPGGVTTGGWGDRGGEGATRISTRAVDERWGRPLSLTSTWRAKGVQLDYIYSGSSGMREIIDIIIVISRCHTRRTDTYIYGHLNIKCTNYFIDRTILSFHTFFLLHVTAIINICLINFSIFQCKMSSPCLWLSIILI